MLLTKEMAEKNKLPVDYGAIIIRENLGESAVIKDSPADKAGLKEFDIILEIQNKKITTENPLSNILQKCQIEQEIELKILREGKKIIAKIKLGEK